MSRFASGKHALAICDRCGFTYDYDDIRPEWNGLRVCPTCWEPKHPQWDPPRVRADAEALRHARPDRVEPFVVSVGNQLMTPPFESYPTKVTAQLGQVTVSIT